MELLGSLADHRRAAIRNRSRSRDQQRAIEQGLAVVALDSPPAGIAGSSALASLDGVFPPWSKGTAKVTPHEHMFP